MTMKKSWLITTLIVAVLIFTNLFTAYKYYVNRLSLMQMQKAFELQRTNAKVVAFTNMLVRDVLQADDEIGFDTRLQLENAVRNLNDKQVLDQWNLFVNSKEPAETQTIFKNLLALLVGKINIIE